MFEVLLAYIYNIIKFKEGGLYRGKGALHDI